MPKRVFPENETPFHRSNLIAERYEVNTRSKGSLGSFYAFPQGMRSSRFKFAPTFRATQASE
jgi:hypothetical protein